MFIYVAIIFYLWTLRKNGDYACFRTDNSCDSSPVYSVHIYTKNILKKLSKTSIFHRFGQFRRRHFVFVGITGLSLITSKSPINFFTIFDLSKSKSTMWRTADKIHHNRNVYTFIIFLPRTFFIKNNCRFPI